MAAAGFRGKNIGCGTLRTALLSIFAKTDFGAVAHVKNAGRSRVRLILKGNKKYNDMKKAILTLFLAAGATALWADSDYDYLVFALQDGTESSLPSENLTIKFPDGKFVATDGKTTFTAPLSEMSRMYFSSTPAGIAAVSTEGDGVSARIVDGRLRVNAPQGTSVRLYRADGAAVSADARLDAGVYVAKVGSRTFKVLAK